MLFADLQKMIAEQMRVSDIDKITPETDIITDLKADSLDIIEMLMQLEEKTGSVISNEEAQKLRKVSDILEIVNKAKK